MTEPTVVPTAAFYVDPRASLLFLKETVRTLIDS